MSRTDHLTRSWIDNLVVWIDRLPGPNLLFYLAGILINALIINAVFWIDGSLPVGQVNKYITAFAIFVLYWIALYQYLTGVAARALEAFLPLIDQEHSNLAQIRSRLLALPRAWGISALLLGFAFAVLSILGEPQSYGTLVPKTALVQWADVVITGFLSATFFCVIIRSFRQLQTVRRLHEQAVNINLLHLAPAHAFAKLTASTGIGIILLLIFSYIYEPSSIDTVLFLTSSAATGLIAIAVFIVPLIGIRSKLETAKEELLDKNSVLIQTATEALHEDILDGRYDNVKDKEAAIGALTVERELYKAIPTWPWDTSVVRGFTSALLLPIVLWIVTRLLERLL